MKKLIGFLQTFAQLLCVSIYVVGLLTALAIALVNLLATLRQ